MEKIKAILINIAKKNVIFRQMSRKILYFYRLIIFKLRGIGLSVEGNILIFFSFKGQSYACSPKAIYEYMQSEPKYDNYEYIWAFDNPKDYKFLEKNKNTTVIKYGGKEFEKKLHVAKYWIFNYRVEDHIYPNKNQIYVQCWHGTPLKKLGYDLANTKNAMNSQKEIYEKYKLDAAKFKYLISPSRFATEKFISAWNLKDINKQDVIIEQGYPRNDKLYNYSQEDVRNIKLKLNIPNNKKVILYAPTWRDDQHVAGIGYTYKTQIDFDLLKEKLSDDYVILFRAHYLVANSFDFNNYKNFVIDVSKVDDINELYIISDILITDYSSVFFDYANLQRPMIFYMYDFESYRDELRGFYMDIEELPGEIIKSEDEDKLVQAIINIHNFKYDEKYKKFNQKYNHLDDGQASKRVIEEVLNGN